MTKTPDDYGLKDWTAQARDRLSGFQARARVDHIGSIAHIGDGVAEVTGLPWTRQDELLRFEDGTLGLAFRVDENSTGCVMLGASDGLRAGTRVFGTGTIIEVPVGEALLGRVVNAVGQPIDGGPAITADLTTPIERPAPGIVDRDLVTSPLMTGVTVVDAMIPIGRGQRELLIGDRKTGKTALAVDVMINQKDTDVICVYAAVGQRASAVSQVIEAVRTFGAPERCIFVVSEADAPPGAQWVTPYAACSMAEYFRDRGRDVLLIVDDLTKHAILYRQLSLLLRKPPGREAYPGDIFYIHARLLERAAKLSPELGGGSLTALPIAETQDGDLSRYIPTNLISITDGQIYLEPKLFYEGLKPAVNVGLSVSRVGGHTQFPAIRELAGQLRLDYAQFLELEVFTRFGPMADERTKRTIEHGRRIRAILVQPEFAPRSLIHQIALLLLIKTGKLDDVPLVQVEEIKKRLADHLDRNCAGIASRLNRSGALSEQDRTDLLSALDLLLEEVTDAARGQEG
ncbi:F0F1 ATP synthase subunit alpha [Aestuariispira ectoiniformans]|uniref:F0F1 ATP synthase subunit alpha n=1 Tax=Aestuariispira ectoiniformans TaxID=2775080 RepID=UPI00223C3C35|nr:F0F1 ATP synthase subunit alpha [Aestuariispira ectoiniformans]